MGEELINKWPSREGVRLLLGWSPCREIEFPMTLIYNLWNRFKIREVHDLFSFSFRQNVGYSVRSVGNIFNESCTTIRFRFRYGWGGVSTKTKTSTRFVFVFVGQLGLALLSIFYFPHRISKKCIEFFLIGNFWNRISYRNDCFRFLE